MKKILSFFAVATALALSAFALEVDRSELESAGDSSTIEFINYTGPHRVINSAAEISGIGSSLGRAVGRDISVRSEAGSRGRYYVIHAVDPSEKAGLDADIMFIGRGASVDHITNLRRIISAYLSSAYGYSGQDADTLAVFITVYNAVYRGNLGAFRSKYKNAVTANLSTSCGLSTDYRDWPGGTEIVIPLYDVVSGGISTVDTSVISDSNVITSMKEDDGRNIESRKDMVGIKEREAEKASEKAQEAQKTAVEEQNRLAEERQKTARAEKEAAEAQKTADEKQKAADEKQKAAEQAQEKADSNPADTGAQTEAEEARRQADEAATEADEAQKAADGKQAEAEQQRTAEAEQQKKTDEASADAAEKQALADRKQSEAQAERKDIAKDQNEIRKNEAAAAEVPFEYGITLADEGQLLSRLVKFSSKDGSVLKSSPVTVIRNRTVFRTDTGFIAVAGENGGNGTVRLVSIDPDNMEITAESGETVAEDSVLMSDGTGFYCIVLNSDGNWVIAKYDGSITLRLKSDVPVNSRTPVSITESGIVVTGADGKMKLLSKDDLKEVR